MRKVAGNGRLHAHFSPLLRIHSDPRTSVRGYHVGTRSLPVSGRFHEWPDKYITLNEFIGILTILS